MSIRGPQLTAGLATMAGLAACAGAWGLVEKRLYTLRRVQVPVLAAGQQPLRVLHISDIHFIAGQRDKAAWITSLAELEPHLVVNTGDNITSVQAINEVLAALDPLLDVPGAFVWGSNDYMAPTFKNPLVYLNPRRRAGRDTESEALPWGQLRDAFEARGWVELTHQRHRLDVAGRTVELRGTDDAHLGLDRYSAVAGPPDPAADLSLGVTHAPYLRVLDAMVADGLDLVIAGHTHGGQVCLPTGALITNCDLDTERVKGLHTHSSMGHTAWLHVSAGLGTSPYAPYRLFCPPEATLLTLVARDCSS